MRIELDEAYDRHRPKDEAEMKYDWNLMKMRNALNKSIHEEAKEAE